MNRHRRLGSHGWVMMLRCGGSPVLAQDASASPAEYLRSLAAIMGRIRTVQWTVGICAERYPETALANLAAVDAWQRKYEPFLTEMTKKFDAMPAYLVAHGESGNYSASAIKGDARRDDESGAEPAQEAESCRQATRTIRGDLQKLSACASVSDVRCRTLLS